MTLPKETPLTPQQAIERALEAKIIAEHALAQHVKSPPFAREQAKTTPLGPPPRIRR